MWFCLDIESTLWDIWRMWKTPLQFVLFPNVFCGLLSVVWKCIFRLNLLYVSCLHFSWWGTLHIMHINGSFTCSNVFWIIIITIRIYAHAVLCATLGKWQYTSLQNFTDYLDKFTEQLKFKWWEEMAFVALPSIHERRKLLVVHLITIHKFGSFIFVHLSICLLLFCFYYFVCLFLGQLDTPASVFSSKMKAENEHACQMKVCIIFILISHTWAFSPSGTCCEAITLIYWGDD